MSERERCAWCDARINGNCCRCPCGGFVHLACLDDHRAGCEIYLAKIKSTTLPAPGDPVDAAGEDQ